MKCAHDGYRFRSALLCGSKPRPDDPKHGLSISVLNIPGLTWAVTTLRVSKAKNYAIPIREPQFPDVKPGFVSI